VRLKTKEIDKSIPPKYCGRYYGRNIFPRNSGNDYLLPRSQITDVVKLDNDAKTKRGREGEGVPGKRRQV